MDWKRLFAPHILDRGYDYYLDDAVEEINISDDAIRATVIGTEEYDVEISLNKGEVVGMYCSCPHAEDGNNCKHMAAVLYQWSEDYPPKVSDEKYENLFLFVNTIEDSKKKVEAVNLLVRDADEETVRRFLSSILVENEKLLVRFHSMVNEQAAEDDVQRYIEQIDMIVQKYSGRHHFIDYYQAGDFVDELFDILHEDISWMIDSGRYMNAFEIMNYIFQLLGAVDMDDSCGGTGMVADQIYSYWVNLLTKVDEREEHQMFQWFVTHLDGSIIDYLEEYIERIIMEEFHKKEYAEKKLIFAEEMIQKSRETESEWSREYNCDKWAMYYLQLLKEQKSTPEKIESFCRKYWKSSSVRRFYIDSCMKKKDYPKALEVLDECITLDQGHRGLVVGYCSKKKEIFLLQGDQKSYLKQLWELALNYDVGNLSVFRELKSQYAEAEWTIEREKIFQKLTPYSNLDELYKEEKLYDRLLEIVLNTHELYKLQQYEGVLKKDYSEQLLNKYKQEVNKMADFSGNRKRYQEIVTYLRRMKKIKGGSKVVETMVDQWKVQYKNRPAMMEELGKL